MMGDLRIRSTKLRLRFHFSRNKHRGINLGRLLVPSTRISSHCKTRIGHQGKHRRSHLLRLQSNHSSHSSQYKITRLPKSSVNRLASFLTPALMMMIMKKKNTMKYLRTKHRIYHHSERRRLYLTGNCHQVVHRKHRICRILAQRRSIRLRIEVSLLRYNTWESQLKTIVL